MMHKLFTGTFYAFQATPVASGDFCKVLNLGAKTNFKTMLLQFRVEHRTSFNIML